MWSKIIGQKRVINILKNIYKSNKIAHSYIFYGKEGIGKDAVAIEFAKLVNCDNKLDSLEACDNCKSCKQINSFVSPYFKFITALPAGKKETSEDENPITSLRSEDRDIYISEIENKIQNNYYNINIPGANDIRIDSIRQIRKEIYLTGYRDKKKVFLLSNCDKMNIQSSNAFLKILEEPPGDSLILMTTSKVSTILPTIVGRCQKIKFNSINTKELTNYLLKIKSDITQKEAEIYASIADGSLLKCINILNSYFLELRETMLEFLLSIVLNKTNKTSKEISKVIFNENREKDKERIRQFLFLLIFWFRDIIFIKNGCEAQIINKDKIERLLKFNNFYDSNNYKIINFIEDSLRDFDLNINPELLLFNLAFKIKAEIKRI